MPPHLRPGFRSRCEDTGLATDERRGAGGALLIINGDFIGGLWLMFIGWFLSSSAQVSSQQTEMQERLRGVSVGQVMNPRPVTVEPGTRLSELVHGYVLRKGVRALPVVEAGELLGLVTLNEVRSVPQGEWDSTPVRFVMTKRSDLHTVRSSARLSDALSTMAEHDVNQLPVVKDGMLVGMISRSNVIRFLEVREELGIVPEEERRAAYHGYAARGPSPLISLPWTRTSGV